MLLSAASKMNPGRKTGKFSVGKQRGIIIDHLQNRFHGSVVFLTDASFDVTLVFNILNNCKVEITVAQLENYQVFNCRYCISVKTLKQNTLRILKGALCNTVDF